MPVKAVTDKKGKKFYLITDREGKKHRYPKGTHIRPHIRTSTKGRYWTGRWIAEFVDKGKRHVHYFDNWGDAGNFMQGFWFPDQDQSEEERQRKKEGLTVRNAVPEYLAHCENKLGYTEGTMHYKRRILGEFVQAFAKRPLGSLSKQEIKKFLDSKGDKGRPSRWNRYRREINALYNYGSSAWEGVEGNPVASLKKQKRKKSRITYIPTNADLKRVIDYAKSIRHRNPQYYNLLIAYRDTWARKNEVLKWTWKDHIDKDNRKVRLVSGKASYEKADVWIPMTADLYEALIGGEHSQWNTRKGDKYVFECRAVWTKNKRDSKNRKVYGGPIKDGGHMITDICKQAGVKTFNYHGIRHNRITHALKSGKPIQGVRDMARHHSISITDTYSHFDESLLDIIE